jgi:hypothetical protein
MPSGRRLNGGTASLDPVNGEFSRVPATCFPSHRQRTALHSLSASMVICAPMLNSAHPCGPHEMRGGDPLKTTAFQRERSSRPYWRSPAAAPGSLRRILVLRCCGLSPLAVLTRFRFGSTSVGFERSALGVPTNCWVGALGLQSGTNRAPLGYSRLCTAGIEAKLENWAHCRCRMAWTITQPSTPPLSRYPARSRHRR